MNKLKIALFILIAPILVTTVFAAGNLDLGSANPSTKSMSEVLSHVRSSTDKNEIVALGKDEVIDRDFFMAGESVEIFGTVNGDVYTAGGLVHIKGTINGDLIVAGGQVIIDGVISNDVRVAGGDIIIKGEIGKNLTVAGGDVALDDSAVVHGSVLATVGNIRIDGTVDENIMLGAGNVVMSGKVLGDLEGTAGEFRITPLAEVGGNVNYWGSRSPAISSSAVIEGDVSYNLTESYDFENSELRENLGRDFSSVGKNGYFTAKIIFSVIGLVSALIVGLLLQRVFPQLLNESLVVIRNAPWKSLGMGFAAIFLTPLAAFILFITVVGFPLGVFAMLSLTVVSYLSKVFVSYWMGIYIFNKFGKSNRRGVALAVGLLVYFSLLNVPFVGALVSLSTLLVGIGVILGTITKLHKKIS